MPQKNLNWMKRVIMKNRMNKKKQKKKIEKFAFLSFTQVVGPFVSSF